ncbi:hypothetical protein [Demequina sp.]|uniref:hypothetical protein n=1 Tax=Demequina sp. TaxID=2050685 RepID=UPI0025BD365F|nr:hypothetical protein [Demequina sp.]
MSESDRENQEVHEGTETLLNIADEVERERERRGRSEFDGPDEPEEQAMSDAAAFSEDNPDIDADTREDH